VGVLQASSRKRHVALQAHQLNCGESQLDAGQLYALDHIVANVRRPSFQMARVCGSIGWRTLREQKSFVRGATT
jgi:hypothetical protein